jgi:hypothetical protein
MLKGHFAQRLTRSKLFINPLAKQYQLHKAIPAIHVSIAWFKRQNKNAKFGIIFAVYCLMAAVVAPFLPQHGAVSNHSASPAITNSMSQDWARLDGNNNWDEIMTLIPAYAREWIAKNPRPNLDQLSQATVDLESHINSRGHAPFSSEWDSVKWMSRNSELDAAFEKAVCSQVYVPGADQNVLSAPQTLLAPVPPVSVQTESQHHERSPAVPTITVTPIQQTQSVASEHDAAVSTRLREIFNQERKPSHPAETAPIAAPVPSGTVPPVRQIAESYNVPQTTVDEPAPVASPRTNAPSPQATIVRTASIPSPLENSPPVRSTRPPGVDTLEPGIEQPRLSDERYPQTREQLLTLDNLKGFTAADVRYAINEIYARYGATFPNHPDVQRQFQQLDWYKPKPELTFDDIGQS